MTSGGKGSMTDLNNTTTSPIYAALNGFLPANDPNPTGKPKAYLNWILLDDQLKYVSSYPQSGAVVVGGAGTLNTLGYTGLPITKNGYLYIWVSNETPNWDVLFDNLSVTHYPGPLLEETHYYPFGLAMSGISSKALKTNYAENKYRYNGGTELASNEFSDGSGIEEYETNFRMQDPQIGRFWQLDPLGEVFQDWSSYSYAFDNPILFNDPLGLEPESVPGAQFIHSKVELEKSGSSDEHPNPAASAPSLPSSVPAPITSAPGSTSKNPSGNQSTESTTNGTQGTRITINSEGGNNTHTTWDRFSDARIRQLDARVQGPAPN